jgi:hypothetical protein
MVWSLGTVNNPVITRGKVIALSWCSFALVVIWRFIYRKVVIL